MMILNRNHLRLALVPVLLLAVTGCSGINTTQSISPGSFFLPGLIQVAPSQKVDGLAAVAAPTPAPAEQPVTLHD